LWRAVLGEFDVDEHEREVAVAVAAGASNADIAAQPVAEARPP
jgi:hypothetical protein